VTHRTTEVAKKYTHLYYEWHRCWDYCPPEPHDCWEVYSFPVSRVTEKRIYFQRLHRANGRVLSEHFISRAAIEPTGEAYHREVREILHLNRPEPRTYAGPGKSLAELRREVADLHPDRGGDPAAFREAHTRYMKAKAATRW
jgi:hypothetical protein